MQTTVSRKLYIFRKIFYIYFSNLNDVLINFFGMYEMRVYIFINIFLNRIGPLKHVKKDGVYKYEFEFKAKTDNMYTITPLSDILLFNPPSLKVFGVNDCHNDIASFAGDLGKVIITFYIYYIKRIKFVKAKIFRL